MNASRKKYPLAIFLGIVWAFLITGYIAFTVTLFLEDKVEDPYVSSAEYIIPYVSSENYSSLYSIIQSNIVCDSGLYEREDYAELIAISEYVEAAFRLKAYQEAGYTDGISNCESKMADAKARMNELSFATDGINKKLSISTNE